VDNAPDITSARPGGPGLEAATPGDNFVDLGFGRLIVDLRMVADQSSSP